MKKSLKFLILLTVLSGCNTLQFWKSDEEKVSGSRHAPALNNAGISGGDSSSATPASAMAMPPMAQAQPGAMPQVPPVPPGVGGDDFMSNPALAQAPQPPAMPGAADSGERRAPEFNRQQLGQNAPSGDLVAASPAPSVAQNSLMPAPPPQMAQAMPQGDLQMPPPPPANNSYPKLADVPQSPSMPKPAAEDARVAQMKQDLADMQQQQTNFQSAGNRTSIKGGAGASSTVENQTPRRPGDGANRPTLVAQSPADPYLANAQTPQVPPPPPMMQQAPQYQAAYNTPPQQNMNQATVQPQGPTVVVHSKNPNARPYNPQMASAMPPAMPYNPPPPPMQNMASNNMMPPPPPPMNQPAAKNNAFPPAPSMRRPAGNLNNGGSQQSSGTSLSQLHPIAVEPAQTYASNSGDAPDGSSFNPQALQPIPSNNIRILPASRYATMRGDARDGSGY